MGRTGGAALKGGADHERGSHGGGATSLSASGIVRLGWAGVNGALVASELHHVQAASADDQKAEGDVGWQR